MTEFDHDFVVVGSGFGGAVCGLRLVEKGWNVRMLEQGREFSDHDYPRSNWDLRRWLWMPALGFRGLFRMSFFRHLTALSGVGVGGGSLVYACTHPTPDDDFFRSGSWAGLADWKAELAPHYERARRMLGLERNPRLSTTDTLLREIAERRGRPEAFAPTEVAIHFGTPGVTVPDPYFGGEGPERTGCIHCGGCMIGCRHGAKNSLDRNYLHLARKRGMRLDADTEVVAVRPLDGGGYGIEARRGRGWFRHRVELRTRNVIFSGGVLGTLPLLLRMKADPRGLPRLSDRLGFGVRTNSEALIGVVSTRPGIDLSHGIAIGSLFRVDAHASLEPVRYPAGSGFFRLLMAPHVAGRGALAKIARMLLALVASPVRMARAYLVRDWAKATSILLYMRVPEGSLRMVGPGVLGGMGTRLDSGEAPRASLPEATELAREFERALDGPSFSLLTESLLDIPTTAHVLGGCGMGSGPDDGVIDRDHRLFGYEGLWVVDGSTLSGNPGVNPSLTILALAERAMAKIEPRTEAQDR